MKFCVDVCSDPLLDNQLEYGGNAFDINKKCANQDSLQENEPFCALWCCSLAFVLCLNPHLSLVQVMDYFTLKTPDPRYLQQKVFHFSRFLFEYVIRYTNNWVMQLREVLIWNREFIHMEKQKRQSASLRKKSESELRMMLDDPTLDSSTRLIIEGMLEEKAAPSTRTRISRITKDENVLYSAGMDENEVPLQPAYIES